MIILPCTQCRKKIKRDYRRYPHQFCSIECRRIWQKAHPNKGQFPKGNEPWNKHLKGIHLSPASEFKKGMKPMCHDTVGTVRIRTRKRDGKQRAWVKVAEPNIWRLRAKVVWEKHYGPIPKGLLIHHIDRDTMNDTITNLAAISRAAHLNEHRHEFKKRSCRRKKQYSK